MTRNSDRRKYERFRVTEGAFAFINNTPFTILNVSHGGMHLQSVVFDGSPDADMQLDLYFQQDNFYLQDLPVRLVRCYTSRASSPFSKADIKSFALQFGELTEQQKSRLDCFIASSSSGTA